METVMRGFMGVLSAIGFAAATVGQTPPRPDPIPVVTVCEVLSDLASYKDKSIIVIGRSDSTDEGHWLSADCDKKLVTNGYSWPDSLSLTYARPYEPPPPLLPKEFTWDTPSLLVKLKDVLPASKPKARKIPDSPESWIAVFGRLETRLPLQTVLWGDGKPHGYGFGHLSGAPAQMISADEAYLVLKRTK